MHVAYLFIFASLFTNAFFIFYKAYDTEYKTS